MKHFICSPQEHLSVVTTVLVLITVLGVGIIGVSRTPLPPPLATSLLLRDLVAVTEPLTLLQKQEKGIWD